MKYISIIILLMLLCLVGCDPAYVMADTVSTVAETTVTTEIVTETVVVEDTVKINELELELQQYKDLISNLNELLGNVGYIVGTNSNYKNEGTAFTISYNDKFYIISAGHLVENEYGKFSSFKYNNISIKLLAHESDFNIGNDYAIFYSDKIDKGFKTGKFEMPAYVLGYGKLNTIKEVQISNKGESGSPIINLNAEVIGIMTGGVVNISKVTKIIDNF